MGLKCDDFLIKIKSKCVRWRLSFRFFAPERRRQNSYFWCENHWKFEIQKNKCRRFWNEISKRETSTHPFGLKKIIANAFINLFTRAHPVINKSATPAISQTEPPPSTVHHHSFHCPLHLPPKQKIPTFQQNVPTNIRKFKKYYLIPTKIKNKFEI